ncbi:MAG: 50S ribosomal protein L6 [Gammaproteobacteria bacterium RIFCSPHIGHO2_12_FULL_41_15]|nr:MAG: 50S ribosomal protein L6 [Gammaproteobacteria bacterium RIFCSPHIGHO2_12_FULL_41_15]
MGSRVAKNPIEIPTGVQVTLNGQNISVKGSKGELSLNIHSLVELVKNENTLVIKQRKENQSADEQAGTARALVNNIVLGVSKGFVRKLLLKGVGYRAEVKGTKINLAVGFSHPVLFELPQGITAECPSQTEIVLKGCDKQQLCQVAANIRRVRPPEPYKGKGIRYDDEHVSLKETKKK